MKIEEMIEKVAHELFLIYDVRSVHGRWDWTPSGEQNGYRLNALRILLALGLIEKCKKCHQGIRGMNIGKEGYTEYCDCYEGWAIGERPALAAKDEEIKRLREALEKESLKLHSIIGRLFKTETNIAVEILEVTKCFEQALKGGP